MIIHFRGCLQNSQVLGSDNEHMASIIIFSINEEDFECNVRQPHGSSHSFENDSIEVEIPEKLKAKINYGAFREVTERYYRSLIGSRAQGGIGIGENVKNTIMGNNRIMKSWSVEIPDIKEGGGGGW